MNKNQFVNLCSRAWAIPALGLIAAGVPARVSPLASKAGAGRAAMASSVAHLVDMGLLRRNPGHGHPLRPEFQLTEEGRRIVEWAGGLQELLDDEAARATARLSWSLPVMGQSRRHHRFNELAASLHPVTDRALAQSLSRLQNVGWLARSVEAEVRPPRVLYQPTLTGELIADHCEMLLAS
ncbi:MAG: winged helix-turn-helix transcriptional regulator [Pseudomonadota bacterium]